jgi:hypothetical protein
MAVPDWSRLQHTKQRTARRGGIIEQQRDPVKAADLVFLGHLADMPARLALGPESGDKGKPRTVMIGRLLRGLESEP